jgi:uncharacterized protein
MTKTFDRDATIDVLRGTAFFAVILVNLATEFSAPFMLYLSQFFTAPGLLNHATSWFVGLLLEGKGLAILSTLFGVSIAMLTEKYGQHAYRVLGQRFLFLLVLGLLHLVILFSGDILTLYALSGLLLVPIIRARSSVLIVFLIISQLIRFTTPWPSLPVGASSQSLIEGAIRFYGNGSFTEAYHFRLFEIEHLILPLLASVWPRVIALMLIGILAWRRGWIQYLQKSRAGVRWMLSALVLGLCLTGIEAFVALKSIDIGKWRMLIGDFGIYGLALGYSTIVFRAKPASLFIMTMGALGRMSLTVYLTQTLLFGFLFYGFGLGLFGIGPFYSCVIGISVYLLQIILCKFYFSRFSQGPVEWLWRKVTFAGIRAARTAKSTTT